MSLRDDLAALLSNGNMQAFLHVIRAGESSNLESGYRMLYGGDLFDSFDDHPRIAKMSPWGWTSAAGAYQAMCAVPGKVTTDTWGDFVRACGPSDFTPLSQDIFAVWCIRRRGAIPEVLHGDLQNAVYKCNKEWASLPGSPYGQPTRTMAGCWAVWKQYGGATQPAEGNETLASLPESVATPAVEAPTVTPEPAPSVADVGHSEEPKTMAPLVPVLLQGLAGALFNIFEPLAREKVERVLTKKGLPSGVGTQIMTVAVETAKAVANQPDPVQATAAVIANPQLVAKVQESTLDTIDRMMPALSQAHKWEMDAWEAEEKSRAAAYARMQGDPHQQEIDRYLTHSIVRIGIGVLAVIAILLGVLAWLKADQAILVSLSTLLVSGASLMFGKMGTRYDHAYGSSRGSDAQKVIIDNLTKGSVK